MVLGFTPGWVGVGWGGVVGTHHGPSRGCNTQLEI